MSDLALPLVASGGTEVGAASAGLGGARGTTRLVVL